VTEENIFHFFPFWGKVAFLDPRQREASRSKWLQALCWVSHLY